MAEVLHGRRICVGRSARPITLYSIAWRDVAGTASANRSEPAWHQAYRALEHRDAAKRCEQNRIQRFPPEIQEFAGLFVDMQRKRHRADYASEGHWLKSEVADDIAQAAAAIALLERAPLKDRRAFAIYVLLRLRPGR